MKTTTPTPPRASARAEAHPPVMKTDPDELVAALTVADSIVQDVDRRRSPEHPDPSNPLGVSFAILLQLQNILRLAVYEQQGRLQHADIARQLPAVATMLARAIREQAR